MDKKKRADSAESLKDSIDYAESSEKIDCYEIQNDSHNDEDSAKEPKFRSIILGAKGLSLGISIVVAILLGIGAGILMQKIFNVFWVLFLGVLWGVLAAILNVYKAYKAEMRDFDELAKNPKYAKRQD